jgi:polysaccharide export outer membrane protein
MKSTHRFLIALALLASAVAGFGQLQPQAPTSLPLQMPSTVAAATVIGPGDLLGMRVLLTPDLDRESRVNKDGVVLLPLVGGFQVAGLNTEQAGNEVGRLLAKSGNFVKAPEVSIVIIEQSPSQRASVLGEVGRPGPVLLVGEQRLWDVISSAGGLLPDSSGLVTITHLDHAEKAFSVRISGSMSTDNNPVVQPGDTIYAAKAGIVYVVGGVAKPGGFMLDSGKTVTLLQALALAEGSLHTAKMKSARLIRSVNDKRQEIPIDMEAVLHNRADDLKMQENDILIIPDSTTKNVLYRSIEGAIEIGTGISIYRF